MCHKHRPNPNEISTMKLIGNVEGKDIIIIDDLIDTAGTICKAADLMMDNGAKSVRAVITHPVLSGIAYENLKNSKLVELITTDTVPLKQKLEKITVLSVDEMLASAIKKINTNESISSTFEVNKE
jgi:ribose-phosphate pyrophosphokinase